MKNFPACKEPTESDEESYCLSPPALRFKYFSGHSSLARLAPVLKTIFYQYHILVASLTLMALF